MATFVMVQSQFVFQLPIVEFHAPTRLGGAHQAPQSDQLWAELREPEFNGSTRLRGPLHQQPFLHPRRMLAFPPMRRPNRKLGETRALGTTASLTPGYGVPSRS